MITTLIVLLTLWTLMGMFILIEFNASWTNWRLFVAVGPIIAAFIGFMVISENIGKWASKK